MPKIETSLLTQQVHNILRERIIGGEYSPGNKLDIHRLAEEFGVSRSPVKSAINELVYDGLLEIIPRKGTYVTALDYTEFIEVLDARLMIERWAASEVIENVPVEKVEQWGDIVTKMDALLDINPFPFNEYSDLDNHFHWTLVQWTGNTKVMDMFSSLNTHVALSRIVHSTSFESTIKRHEDHWNIYQAMKDRNLEACSKAITDHIESLKNESKARWNEIEVEQ